MVNEYARKAWIDRLESIAKQHGVPVGDLANILSNTTVIEIHAGELEKKYPSIHPALRAASEIFPEFKKSMKKKRIDVGDLIRPSTLEAYTKGPNNYASSLIAKYRKSMRDATPVTFVPKEKSSKEKSSFFSRIFARGRPTS